jgi:hypothetical protein
MCGRQNNPPERRKIHPGGILMLKTLIVFLARLLAFLLALVLCLPTALLPQATAVPAWAWIPLAAADLGLLFAFFCLKPAGKATIGSLAGLLAVAVLAVATSQAFAMTPPLIGADGRPLPGSLAKLETVTLNGSQQWISIRSLDTSKPVLLFLAGGPGGSQLATVRFALEGLEQHFIVVNWEQPGAGKSFDAVDRSTMTPERYIEDAHALVTLLKMRFDQEKVYVLKEIVWFEYSGHNPRESESERFVEVMVDTVLAQTQQP